MKEKELERSPFSQAVVMSILLVSAVFMATGLWYMYLKPLIGEIARS
jgi:hypothetical protein